MQSRASPLAQTVKDPPSSFTGWKDDPLERKEDPLEKRMATHSSILAWRIPWTEEPGGLQSIGSERVRHDWRDSAHTHTATWKDLETYHTKWSESDRERQMSDYITHILNLKCDTNEFICETETDYRPREQTCCQGGGGGRGRLGAWD